MRLSVLLVLPFAILVFLWPIAQPAKQDTFSETITIVTLPVWRDFGAIQELILAIAAHTTAIPATATDSVLLATVLLTLEF